MSWMSPEAAQTPTPIPANPATTKSSASVCLLTPRLYRARYEAPRRATISSISRRGGLQASGAEVVQEPIKQPYGVSDCAFRDPAGNLIRINEPL
jgi:hypothetical protein